MNNLNTASAQFDFVSVLNLQCADQYFVCCFRIYIIIICDYGTITYIQKVVFVDNSN